MTASSQPTAFEPAYIDYTMQQQKRAVTTFWGSTAAVSAFIGGLAGLGLHYGAGFDAQGSLLTGIGTGIAAALPVGIVALHLTISHKEKKRNETLRILDAFANEDQLEQDFDTKLKSVLDRVGIASETQVTRAALKEFTASRLNKMGEKT